MSLLLPKEVYILIGVQAASLFWLALHVISTIIVAPLVSDQGVPWQAMKPYLVRARENLKNAFVSSVNKIVTYATSVVSFAAQNWQYFVLGAACASVGFVVLNYQAALIVVVDDTWQTLGTIVFTPIKALLNFVFVIAEIFVGLLNFLSQYAGTVLRDTTRELIRAPGYFKNFYDILPQAANSIASTVGATVTWLNKLSRINRGLTFSLDTSSAANDTAFYTYDSTTSSSDGTHSNHLFLGLGQVLLPSFDLAPAIKPLRLIVYDASLRLRHTCPAENGILGLPIHGIIDNTTSVVDDLLSCSLNALLAGPEAVIMMIIVLFKHDRYVPLNVNPFFDYLMCMNRNLEAILNQLLSNVINFIEDLIKLIPGTATNWRWKPINLFSIRARELDIYIDTGRAIANAFVNVPLLFTNYPVSDTAGPNLDLYDNMFDFRRVFDDVYAFTNTTAFVLGNINEQYLLGITNIGREFANVYISYFEFGAHVIRRLMLGRDPLRPDRFFDSYAANYANSDLSKNCVLDTTYAINDYITNFWTGLYDLMQVFDTTVTRKIYNLAFTSQENLRRYYPPVTTTLNLAIMSAGNLQTTILRKVVYLTTAVLIGQPPQYGCMLALGNVTRQTVDNFLVAVPDLTDFFLDVAQARGLQNAHFNCMNTNVHNFILAGSLKSFYFAGKMCNVRYKDGSLLACDYANPLDCPQYALPYADINTNLVCSVDSLVVGVLKQHVQSRRLLFEYAEEHIVKTISCFIDTNTCHLTDYVPMQKTLSQMSVLGCFTYETTVKIANLVSGFLSFVYDFIYRLAHTESGSLAFNSLRTEAPQLAEFFNGRQSTSTIGHTVTVYTSQTPVYEKMCTDRTKNKDCIYDNICQWDGTGCHLDTGSQLHFQHFPLEAATSTFITSIGSVIFWSQYLVFVHFARVAAVVDSQFQTLNSGITHDSMTNIAGSIISLSVEDPYYVILDGIRVSTLAIRDVIWGFMELIRSFVYVISDCTVSTCTREKPISDYFDFSKVLVEIVTLLEDLLAALIGIAFKFLVDAAFIITDLLGIISGTKNAEAAFVDILRRFLDMIVTFANELTTFIYQLPGINDICSLINAVIDGFLNPVIGWLSDLLHGNIDLGLVSFALGSFIPGLPDFPLIDTLPCLQNPTPPSAEATMCLANSECTVNTSQCVIFNSTHCNAVRTQTQEDFDFACPCAHIVSGNFHCNFGSGFCEEGLSPYGDPLATCPPLDALVNPQNNKSAFVDSTEYYNSMCWVVPAYECSSWPNASTATIQECIHNRYLTTIQNGSSAADIGPHLCRDYCSPSAFSIDNLLLQDPLYGCYCALGYSIGSGLPPVDVATSFLENGLSLFDLSPSGYQNKTPPGRAKPKKTRSYERSKYVAPLAPDYWWPVYGEMVCSTSNDEKANGYENLVNFEDVDAPLNDYAFYNFFISLFANENSLLSQRHAFMRYYASNDFKVYKRSGLLRHAVNESDIIAEFRELSSKNWPASVSPFKYTKMNERTLKSAYENLFGMSGVDDSPSPSSTSDYVTFSSRKLLVYNYRTDADWSKVETFDAFGIGSLHPVFQKHNWLQSLFRMNYDVRGIEYPTLPPKPLFFRERNSDGTYYVPDKLTLNFSFLGGGKVVEVDRSGSFRGIDNSFNYGNVQNFIYFENVFMSLKANSFYTSFHMSDFIPNSQAGLGSLTFYQPLKGIYYVEPHKWIYDLMTKINSTKRPNMVISFIDQAENVHNMDEKIQKLLNTTTYPKPDFVKTYRICASSSITRPSVNTTTYVERFQKWRSMPPVDIAPPFLWMIYRINALCTTLTSTSSNNKTLSDCISAAGSSKISWNWRTSSCRICRGSNSNTFTDATYWFTYAPKPIPPLPPMPPPSPPPPPVVSKVEDVNITRRNLQAQTPTQCATSATCTAWNAACQHGGTMRKCSSCPEQNFWTQQDASTCLSGLCACVVATEPNVDASNMTWEGYSRCAVLGRAYGNVTYLTPLERVELRRCVQRYTMANIPARYLYDPSEAFRVATHYGVGALVGAVGIRGTDEFLQQAFSEMRVDPALAVPAARSVEAFSTFMTKNFPSMMSQIKSVWLRLQKLPSRQDVGKSFTFLHGIGSLVVDRALAEKPALREGVSQVARNVAERVRVVETQRQLLASGDWYTTCPIITNFYTDLIPAANILEAHMTKNVQRQACRLLNVQGGDSWSTCTMSTWDTPRVYNVTLLHENKTEVAANFTATDRKHGFLTSLLFTVVHDITGIRPEEKLHKLTNFLLNLSPSRSNIAPALRSTVNKLKCSYDTTPQCLAKKGTLLPQILRYVLELGLVSLALKVLRLGSVNMVVMPLLILFGYSIVMQRTYGLEFGCSISIFPVLPACLVSDIQDIIYMLTPKLLPWPSPLVNTANRVTETLQVDGFKVFTIRQLQTSDIFDCGAVGFGDGVRELVYLANRYLPGWQKLLPTLTHATIFGQSIQEISNTISTGAPSAKLHEQCASLYSVTAVPILLFFATCLVFSLAALHVVVIFSAHIVKALQNVFMATLAAFFEVSKERDDE
jgi:hypothetical protein